MDLVSPFLEGIVEWVQSKVANFLDLLISAFSNDFEISSAYFFEKVGATNGEKYNYEFFDVFILIALVIGLLIFVFHILLCTMGAFTEQKNAPLELCLRFFFFAMPLMYIIRPALDLLNGVFQNVVDIIAEPTIPDGGRVNTDSPFSTFPEDTASVLLTIVSLALYFSIMMQFLKLLGEIIERYIVLMLMVVCSPIACATLTSRTTNSIFNNYVRMYMSQLFLMLMNKFFLNIVIQILYAGALDFFGVLFLLTIIKCAQRVDSYMSSLGLSVAQTGGSILEDIMASVGGMKSMLGMAKKGAGLVAKGAQKLGAATGNYGLSKAGSVAGGILSGKGSNPLSDFANAGGMSNVRSTNTDGSSRDNNALMKDMQKAMERGDYKALAGLGSKDALKQFMSQNDAFKKATGIDPSGIKDIKMDAKGNITGTATCGGKTLGFKATMQPSAGSTPINSTPDGTTRYLSTTPLEKFSSGDSIDFNHEKGGKSNFSSLTGYATDDDRLSNLGCTEMSYDGNQWHGTNAEGNEVYCLDTSTGVEMYSGSSDSATNYSQDEFKADLKSGALSDLTGGNEGIVHSNDDGSVMRAEFDGNSEYPNGYAIVATNINHSDMSNKNARMLDKGSDRGTWQVRKIIKKQ